MRLSKRHTATNGDPPIPIPYQRDNGGYKRTSDVLSFSPRLHYVKKVLDKNTEI